MLAQAATLFEERCYGLIRHYGRVTTKMPQLCAGCGKETDEQMYNGKKGKYCQACYRYERKHGTVVRRGVKPALSMEIIIQVSERDPDTNCLVWKGETDRDGYPRYFDGVRHAHGAKALVYVRRWLVDRDEAFWPKGQIVESSCGERLCVEPSHLSITKVSNGRWTQAGINSRKTHCQNGHELPGDNIYWADGGRR
ncbi:hypothetical protein GCM10022419_056690 [Nonomuraea rosea]|uniref:HNH nuclease domain-containing protein n=1 Tax=Nonomuraea rosea TaxID=638574 RepID=A0ABP6XL48_9ACTN